MKSGFLNTITSFINLEMSREASWKMSHKTSNPQSSLKTSCKMSYKTKSNLPVANAIEKVIEGVPKLAH
ncbi:hypothetical protein FOPG_02387 [Fusarium oxysporum f. sp. conglutinans race 2 54008]|uniref:Uncharacterized protein n=4 Tax=Hypocreales TaxID=5125 RepID=A0A420PC96_FUSOX|nr:hypothetical protein FOPG_02387 [Fusarium oxysporum f. sp. conglutinans race 2 54008]RKK06345.1 hypothetical protein BFJ65_g18743 [Fusarium oxysporum f. sp. cepae]RKK64982.1 hypothetical protein BFJ69_g16536 [Fusarium oxysporum]RKK26638.1 hypothetical protein BFJ67_g16547 [Fusarium oxysporum f. sp. cepae]RKK27520.1 hypothetical protein BFJ66_g16616 [Fusarium oxysporum f. sp. cepae]